MGNPDLVLGFCGPLGGDGVYRFQLGESSAWEFYPPETGAWNYYHQMAFRQHKLDPCTFGEIAGQVPSPPTGHPPPDPYHLKERGEASRLMALAGGALVNWARRLLPGGRLLKKIRAAPGRRLPVYVVLHEDRYESAFGDGVFRYFDSAHLDESAAKAHIDRYYAGKEWSELHIREVALTVSGWTLALATEDRGLSPFDHFTKNNIVRDLAHPERRRDPWGEPYRSLETTRHE